MNVPSVGSVWVSLDPRDQNRLVKVTALSASGQFVFVRPYGTQQGRRPSRIHVSRFDGKQWKQQVA